MSTAKKSDRMKFWMVVFGLFLFIGLVAGGAYVLDNQGLISMGEIGPGEMPAGSPPDLEEGASRPPRPDGDEEGLGFNSGALMGILEAVMQIVLVVLAIAGGQWLYGRLQHRRRRSPA